MQTFWAHYRKGRNKCKRGPFLTREAAVAEAVKDNPKHKTLYTGYGLDAAYFDIRWHDEETNPYR